jgi:2,4-dienoyl-CoA reductase-like NADH-dependent reductase (Old Yellow Enzyme family)
MTEDDMKRICADFKKAATFMMNAGFDGILVHGGHGFLFTQFLSPSYNKRTDEFGGSLQNRARFPIMILKTVREAIGEHKILELRVSGADGREGSIIPE